MKAQIDRLARRVLASPQGVITTAKMMLADYGRDPDRYNQGELSDWGINVVREEARKMDYDRDTMSALLSEEANRLRGFTADEKGLDAYLKMSRSGSPIRMSRRMRVGLFCQLAAKGVLRKGRYAATRLAGAGQYRAKLKQALENYASEGLEAASVLDDLVEETEFDGGGQGPYAQMAKEIRQYVRTTLHKYQGQLR